MTWNISRNISFATVSALREIRAAGEIIVVRAKEVRELRNRVTVLTSPKERCLLVPGRNNNVIASVAETLWVLRGGDNLPWLTTYLPRAPQFSDDNGQTWRAAYGPRLRRWQGIDQLDAVRQLLTTDSASRRAVITLFDPVRDFAESKDIPCNNWLHWLIRDGRLHLNVVLRSNDVWWGFSGVNSFEWSVLQEAMAGWVGVEVGDLTFFASSLHLYAQHYEAAAKAVSSFRGITCYDFDVPPARFSVPWDKFDSALAEWFALEDGVRRAPGLAIPTDRLPMDDFLRTSLFMAKAYLGHQSGWNVDRLRIELAAMPENDLTAATYEYFGRKLPQVLQDVPQTRIASFLAAYRSPVQPAKAAIARIKISIKTLHAAKNAAYQNAWKRRGEHVSTLANIARKVDRLETAVRTGSTLADESILDTAIDLFVYVTKYRLFLLELTPVNLAADLLPDGATPYSDHVANFDALVERVSYQELGDGGLPKLIADIAAQFERVHGLAADGADATERLNGATDLSELAWRLVLGLIDEQPARLDHL